MVEVPRKELVWVLSRFIHLAEQEAIREGYPSWRDNYFPPFVEAIDTILHACDPSWTAK